MVCERYNLIHNQHLYDTKTSPYSIFYTIKVNEPLSYLKQF